MYRPSAEFKPEMVEHFKPAIERRFQSESGEVNKKVEGAKNLLKRFEEIREVQEQEQKILDEERLHVIQFFGITKDQAEKLSKEPKMIDKFLEPEGREKLQDRAYVLKEILEALEAFKNQGITPEALGMMGKLYKSGIKPEEIERLEKLVRLLPPKAVESRTPEELLKELELEDIKKHGITVEDIMKFKAAQAMRYLNTDFLENLKEPPAAYLSLLQIAQKRKSEGIVSRVGHVIAHMIGIK